MKKFFRKFLESTFPLNTDSLYLLNEEPFKKEKGLWVYSLVLCSNGYGNLKSLRIGDYLEVYTPEKYISRYRFLPLLSCSRFQRIMNENGNGEGKLTNLTLNMSVGGEDVTKIFAFTERKNDCGFSIIPISIRKCTKKETHRFNK